MYKLEKVPDLEFKYLSEPLHFNKMPKPYRSISRSKFEELSRNYSPNYIDNGQVHDLDDSRWAKDVKLSYYEARYYFYETYAIARIETHKRTNNRKITVKYRYYILGCNHEWEFVSGDKFSTKCRCKKCGMAGEFQTGY